MFIVNIGDFKFKGPVSYRSISSLTVSDTYEEVKDKKESPDWFIAGREPNKIQRQRKHIGVKGDNCMVVRFLGTFLTDLLAEVLAIEVCALENLKKF